MERATGPKPANRARACFSSGVAGRFSCSIVVSVRMAARMSRALAFSPLAMAIAGDREACGEGTAVGWWVAAVSALMGSLAVSLASGGSAGPGGGLAGGESNSVGWRRDAFTRAA